LQKSGGGVGNVGKKKNKFYCGVKRWVGIERAVIGGGLSQGSGINKRVLAGKKLFVLEKRKLGTRDGSMIRPKRSER